MPVYRSAHTMTANEPPAGGGASSLAAEAEEVYRQRQQLEGRMEALASFLTSEGNTTSP